MPGSGIAPFFPVPAEPSGIYLPMHAFLFVFRLTLLITVTVGYVLGGQWLPIGSLLKKAFLWSIFGIGGLWWIDLQIDGVRRGYRVQYFREPVLEGLTQVRELAHNSKRLPGPGSIIASSFTSPLDVLYLAAIFDPVFTASHPSSSLVEPISLFTAVYCAFTIPRDKPPHRPDAVDLAAVLRANPKRPVVVFPECTTTNGRGILPIAPSLLDAPRETPIFPVSLRYTAADVTTPVPGSFVRFLWNFLSRPHHSIRIRIARSELGSKADDVGGEKKLLDRVADALARLGRVQRVSLGIKEKCAFVQAWTKVKR